MKRNPYPPPPHTAFCSSKGILAITYRVITCNIHSTPSCSRTQKHIPQFEQMCRSPTCNVHSIPCSTAQKHIITTNAQTTHLVPTFDSFMFNNSTETHNWDKCARRPLAGLIQLFTFKHQHRSLSQCGWKRLLLGSMLILRLENKQNYHQHVWCNTHFH